MKYTRVAAALCMTLSWALAAPVQAAGTADATPPGPAGTTPDVRCMVVMMNLSQSNEQRQQMEALVGSFYFLGRIDAQDSKLDLEKHITGEMSAMTDAQFAVEAQRCDDAMRGRMRTLSTMADDLDKQAHPGGQSAPAPGDAPVPPPK